MATAGALESGMKTTRRPLSSRKRSTLKVGAGGRLLRALTVGMGAKLTRSITAVTVAVPVVRPVFVYGTLRPGQVNWEHRLAGRVVEARPGRLPGVALLDCGPYPAAVERPGAPGVAGDLVWVDPGRWAETMRLLDDLEGYVPGAPDNLYERALRPVDTHDGPVEAWVYLAGRDLAEAPIPEIPGGDWVAHQAGEGR